MADLDEVVQALDRLTTAVYDLHQTVASALPHRASVESIEELVARIERKVG